MGSVESFISTLRDSVPNADVVFTQGNCFKLYILLNKVWSEAKPYYDGIAGHVYTKIGDKFYDIHGELVGSTPEKKAIKGRLYYMPERERLFRRAHRWKYRCNEK